MNRTQLHTTLMAAALTFASALSGVAQAGPEQGTIPLLTTPPELTTTVAPNIVVTFDDSGSMMATSMPDAIEASHANRYYFSSTTNLIYFDPTKEYPPPLYADGTSFPNASYTSAWRDGICANAPGSYCYSSPNTKDLSTRFYQHFRKSTSSGDSPNANTGDNISETVRGGSSGVYNGGFYYNCPTPYSNSGCTRIQVNNESAEVKQKFANWYSYYRTRNLLSRTALTHAFNRISGDVRVAWQTINSDFSGATPALRNRAIDNIGSSSDVNQWRQDFFNWIYNRNTTGGTPVRRATIEAGRFFERSLTEDMMNPYWEPYAGGDTDLDGKSGRNLSCRKNFHMSVTDGYWNESDPSVPSGYFNGETTRTLPDGEEFSVSDPESRVIWDVQGSLYNTSLANIAFHYWAKDLQPTLENNVTPYMPDKSTGVTGTVPFDPNALPPANDPLKNKEIYWNPANNPATWQHVSQFMVTLGVAGTLSFPDDLAKLRKGQATSAGTVGWPRPVNNNPAGVDDTWHGAVNSRGAYFSANNPQELVDRLSDVLASIIAQSTSSTPAAVSLPILTGGNSIYQGGYNSANWSGILRRRTVDANGLAGDALWDAACLLSGGTCQEPSGTSTARTPDSRIIITSDGSSTGLRFRWNSLTEEQKAALDIGGYGEERVNYLRGERSKESGGSVPQLRTRGSVLGAIVNSDPVYVSSPRSGYRDMFPPGSPEAEAALVEEGSYAGYQNAQRARRPVVYVGANDGMLHAFDAKSGKELWAFVPNTLIRNGRLHSMTVPGSNLIPGVDSSVRERDVFLKRSLIGAGSWRTILLGSLRLGGRGIYALDVTDPDPANETVAAGNAADENGIVLWEFTNGDVPSAEDDSPCAPGSRSCASLGYTYDSANVARIKYQNKWVAVVSSGYFPENSDVAAKPTDASEPAAKRTSLLVIDLATGELIREIRTSLAPQERPQGFKTYGLSTPMVYDEGSDQVDDLVYAGDLAGNLWRFDLSAEDPDEWSVDLMFTTYAEGGADNVGDQPFVFNPTALRDPVTRRPILIIGSGKYLGEPDRVSNIPQQAYFGIRDYGSNSEYYPIRPEQLVTQHLAQADEVREITGYTEPAAGKVQSGTPPMRMASEDDGAAIVTSVPAHGWRMPLDIGSERGERAQRRAIPMTTANVAILYGLIPKDDDPCDPGARYSVMVVGGATGSALAVGEDDVAGSGEGVVGGVAATPSPPADPVVVRGGGRVVIPGLSDQLDDDVSDALDAATPPWHRGAWRDLLDW